MAGTQPGERELRHHFGDPPAEYGPVDRWWSGTNWEKRMTFASMMEAASEGRDPRFERQHGQRRIQLRNAVRRHHTPDTGRAARDVGSTGRARG